MTAAVYVQTFAALVMMLFAVIDRLNFARLPLPLGIAAVGIVTVVFVAAWATAVVRSRRGGQGMSTRALTAVVISASFVVIASGGLLTASSDDGSNADTATDETDAPQRTPSPEPDGDDRGEGDGATRLCAAAPEPAATSWLLYETAGVERRITIERDGERPTSIPGAQPAVAGSSLVYVDVTDNHRVELMDLSTMTKLGSRMLDGRVIDTTMSDNGDHIVLVEDRSGDSRLVLWRPADDELHEVLDPIEDIAAVALSPAADRLAWVKGSGSSGRLVILDMATRGERLVDSDGGHPDWSPDGSALVYSAPHGEGRAIHVVAAGGGESTRLTNPVQADDFDPVVRPTCDGLVYTRSQDGAVDLWEARADGTEGQLLDLNGVQSRPAFGTD